MRYDATTHAPRRFPRKCELRASRISVKSPIDADRLTTVRVIEMFAPCLQRRR